MSLNIRLTQDEYKEILEMVHNSKLMSGFSSKYRGGVLLQEFEDVFARYVGTRHAVAVNSGTTGLIIAMRALKTALGKKNVNVAVPSYTFTACPASVIFNGDYPVFKDIDPETYCLLPDNINDVDVTMAVHNLGHCVNMSRLDPSIPVLEDCAQSFGCEYNGKKVGSMGRIGMYSFQETKTITTFGEGGMLVTNDDALAELCRQLRNHGEYYANGDYAGGNFRMTEVQAACGMVQMRRVNDILRDQREKAEYLIKSLPEFITPPITKSYCKRVYYIIACRYDEKVTRVNRDLYIEELNKERAKHIETISSDIQGANNIPGKIVGPGYRKTLYEVPLYAKYRPKQRCVNAEECVKRSIWLDIHRWRSYDEINLELELINKVMKRLQSR